MVKRRKSQLERAFGTKRKSRKGGGLNGAFGEVKTSKRKRSKGFGLENSLDLFSKTKKRRGMSEQFIRTIQNRFTPTERKKLSEDVEEELRQDQQLQNKVSDESVTGNESFLRRLVNLVKQRISAFGK